MPSPDEENWPIEEHSEISPDVTHHIEAGHDFRATGFGFGDRGHVLVVCETCEVKYWIEDVDAADVEDVPGLSA